MMLGRHDASVAEQVALLLAVGISVALNIMVITALVVSIKEHQPLGENATQLLTGWGGGILGVLGAFVGYQFGKKANGHTEIPEPPRPPRPPPPPPDHGQQ